MLALIILILGIYQLGTQAFHRGRNDSKIKRGWRWQWLGCALALCFFGVLTVAVQHPNASLADFGAGGLGVMAACLAFYLVACLIAWGIGRSQRQAYARSKAPPPLPPQSY